MPNNKITVKAVDNKTNFYDVAEKESVRTYELNFSPWAEDYGNISAVEWSVKFGSPNISNETLTSNKATALIDFPNAGISSVKVKATSVDGSKFVCYINIRVKDSVDYIDEYGHCSYWEGW